MLLKGLISLVTMSLIMTHIVRADLEGVASPSVGTHRLRTGTMVPVIDVVTMVTLRVIALRIMLSGLGMMVLQDSLCTGCNLHCEMILLSVVSWRKLQRKSMDLL
jgi:hypothetical protein